MAKEIRDTGHAKVILRSDDEPSIIALKRAVEDLAGKGGIEVILEEALKIAPDSKRGKEISGLLNRLFKEDAPDRGGL